MAQGMTQKEYLEKLAVQNPTIDGSEVEYENARSRVNVSCKTCGHAWEVTAGSLIGKKATGCKKCSTKNRKHRAPMSADEWWARASKRHNDAYECDLSNYVDQYTEIPIKCPIHGVFYKKPVTLLHSSGCAECGKYSGNARLDKAKVIDRIEAKFPGQYLTDKVEYVNQRTPVNLTCKKHGEFSKTPKVLFKGIGCPECSKENRSNNGDAYFEKVTKMHNGKYDYSEAKYVNSYTKIKIKCPEHGYFEQRPDTHLKHGCLKCGLARRRMGRDEFMTEVKRLHPELVIDAGCEYTTQDKPAKLKCARHGYFHKIASDLLRTRPDGKAMTGGCNKCAASYGEQRIMHLLSSWNILYVREYKIPKSTYRYDFYLPNLNILLEYDGEQHYRPVEMLGGTEGFVKRTRRDYVRDELAVIFNIPLIRIPYTKYDELETYLPWCLSKHYKYHHNGKFYKSINEFIDDNKGTLAATEILGKNKSKYKTTNLCKS